MSSAYGVEQTTFALNLLRFLRSEQIDLLHVQDPQVAMIVQKAHSLGLVPTRTILAHGTEEPVGFLSRIEYVQHLAPWHEDECRRSGVSRPHWTSIPNFIDTNRFSPGRDDGIRADLGIPTDALVVLTSAAIKRKHKRIDVLIDEFARLIAERPDIPAWLVIAGGENSDTEELMTQGRELLGDRVRFLVQFPRDRMTSLYRSADVFVLNSLKEMMPIAVLEATASGLPCIVHNHPVLTWMVGSGGAVTDLSVQGALTASLIRLLTDKAHRLHLGRLAREHCITTFGEAGIVDQIGTYYHSILNRPLIPPGHPPRSAHDVPVFSSVQSSTRDTVSVIIPTFNSAQWIVQAVDSVLAQTVPPSEVIVIDDGSTDDTRQRLLPYLDRIRYVVQANHGVASARNHGIALSRGSLLAFLDADDIWHPRKLELQLSALASHPELKLLGTHVFDWPSVSPQDLGGVIASPIKLSWQSLVVKNQLTTSSVIVRRSALDKAGAFDTALHGPEDFDLWLRIAETGLVGNLALPLVGYRTVAGSLGRRVTSMEAGLRRILEKLDERGSWHGQWLLRRKAHSYSRYSCAYQHLEAGNPPQALQRLLSSLASYPIPYRRSEVRIPLARLRMLLMIFRRMLVAPERPRIA